MSGQPWETHDRLCPNRRPTVAFPNSACSGCRAVVAARAEGYARGLIEGDHGGRREGYRSGYAAGKDAVMTSSYEQAVTQGEMEALGKWIDGVAKGRDDAAVAVAALELASCESMIEHVSRFAAVNAARGPMSEQRCVVCGDAITDWGDGDWHHVPRTDPDDYLKGHDHDVLRSAP